MSMSCQRPAYEHKAILDYLQDTFLRTVNGLRRRSPWQSCLEEGPIKSDIYPKMRSSWDDALEAISSGIEPTIQNIRIYMKTTPESDIEKIDSKQKQEIVHRYVSEILIRFVEGIRKRCPWHGPGDPLSWREETTAIRLYRSTAWEAACDKVIETLEGL